MNGFFFIKKGLIPVLILCRFLSFGIFFLPLFLGAQNCQEKFSYSDNQKCIFLGSDNQAVYSITLNFNHFIITSSLPQFTLTGEKNSQPNLLDERTEYFADSIRFYFRVQNIENDILILKNATPVISGCVNNPRLDIGEINIAIRVSAIKNARIESEAGIYGACTGAELKLRLNSEQNINIFRPNQLQVKWNCDNCQEGSLEEKLPTLRGYHSFSWRDAGRKSIRVQITDEYTGCSTELSEAILVDNPLTFEIQPEKTTVCPKTASNFEPLKVNISGSLPAGALLRLITNSGSVENGANWAEKYVSWQESGVYRLGLEFEPGNYPCPDIAFAGRQITVLPLPNSDFDLPTLLCSANSLENSRVNLHPQRIEEETEYIWLLEPYMGFDFVGAGPHPISWPTEGVKTLTLEAKRLECANKTIKTISVMPTPPEPRINSYASELCASVATGEATASIRVVSAEPNVSYQWSCGLCEAQAHTTAGPHIFRWRQKKGQDSVKVSARSLHDGQLFCVSPPALHIAKINLTPESSFSITPHPVSGQFRFCTQEAKEYNAPIFSCTCNNAANDASFTWNCNGCQGLNQGEKIQKLQWASAGVKTVSLTVTNPGEPACSSTGQEVVTILKTPTHAFYVDPVCENTSQTNNQAELIYLGSDTAAQFHWNCDGCSLGIFPLAYSQHKVAWASAGLKTVTLEVISNDDGYCSRGINTFIVTVHPAPKVEFNLTDTKICQGMPLSITFIGSAEVNAVYAWDFGLQATPTRANSIGPHSVAWNSPGIKTIALSVIHQSVPVCQVTGTPKIVEVYPSPQFTLTYAPPCPEEALVIGAQPATGLSYFWSGPQGFSLWGESFNRWPAVAGTYTVTATDSRGCAAEKTLEVSLQSSPQVGILGDTVICKGESVTLEAVASTGSTYLWRWNDGASSFAERGSILHVNAAPAGIYTLEVTSAQGCQALKHFRVTYKAATPVTLLPIAPVCSGRKITLFAEGAQKYRWLTPGSPDILHNQREDISDPTAGVYTLNYLNANGCWQDTLIEVIVHPLPTPSAFSNSPVCEGQTLALTATGGVSYDWAGPNGFSAQGYRSSTLEINNISAASGGVYTLTAISVNNCAANAVIEVEARPRPAAAADFNRPSGRALCEKDTLRLLASPDGMQYLWLTPGGRWLGEQNPIIPAITPLHSGVYTLTVTNPQTGCSAIKNLPIVINPRPKPQISASPTALCTGQPLTLSGLGGDFSQWWKNDTLIFPYARYLKPEVELSDAGVYQFKTWNNFGCRDSAFRSITVHLTPKADIINTAPSVCQGDTFTLETTPENGISYLWEGPGAWKDLNALARRPAASVGESGIYTLTAINSTTGCVAQSFTEVQVKAIPQPSIIANRNPLCEGAQLILTAVGGVRYAWRDVQNNLHSSPIFSRSLITLADTGYYVLLAQNAEGCQAEKRIHIRVYSKPIVKAESNSPFCADLASVLELKGSGGEFYLWQGPGFFSAEQNPKITNATSRLNGVYTLTVTDSNGCTATDTTLVRVKEKPVLLPDGNALNNSPLCERAPLRLFGFGKESDKFEWQGPDNFSSTLQNPTIPAELKYNGNFTLTITSADGCTLTATTNVTVKKAPPVPLFTTNAPLCAGGTLELEGISEGTQYLWQGPNSFSARQQKIEIPNVSVLNAGDYIYKVTNAEGCTSGGVYRVEIFPLPQVRIRSNSPICENNKLELSWANLNPRIGIDSWVWILPDNSTSYDDRLEIQYAKPFISGTYQLKATSKFGQCDTTLIVPVIVNPLPVDYSAERQSDPCLGEPLYLIGIGASSYSYRWRGPDNFESAQQNPIRPNMKTDWEGIYTLSVFSAEGCKGNEKLIAIEVKTPPIVTATESTKRSCLGDTIRLIGGVGDALEYAWEGPSDFGSNQKDTFLIATNQAKGRYYLTGKNANGCKAKDSVDIDIDPLPTNLKATASSKEICAKDTLHLYAEGASNYHWQGPNGWERTGAYQRLLSMSAIQEGAYILTGFTENGCKSKDTISIRVNPLPELAGFRALEETCEGGLLPLTATGAAHYSWQGKNWYTEGNSVRFIAPQPDIYDITLSGRSDKGCKKDTTLKIRIYPRPANDFNAQNVCAQAATQQTLSRIIYTGPPNPNALYFWNCDGCSETLTTTSGPFSVKWKDAGIKTLTLQVEDTAKRACVSLVKTVTITVNPAPVIETLMASNSCANSANSASAVSAVIHNANAQSQYDWSVDGLASMPIGAPPLNLAWDSPGVYTISLRVINPAGEIACSSSAASTIVTVHSSPVISLLEPIVAAKVCAQEPILLKAASNEDVTYEWQCEDCQPENLPSTSGPFSVAWQEPGIHTIRLSAKNREGCNANAIIKPIETLPRPIANIEPIEPVCVYKAARISYKGFAAPDLQYDWECDGCTGLNSPAAPSFIARWAKAGVKTIRLRLEQNGCKDTAIRRIEVMPLPQADFALPTSACARDSVRVEYTGGSGGWAKFLWSCLGCGRLPSNTPFPFTTFWQNEGQKEISLTVIEKGCTSEKKTQEIRIHALPEVIIEVTDPSCDSCQNGKIIVTPRGDALPYEVSINGNAYQPLSNLEGLEPGNYELKVRDANGCVQNLSISLVTSRDKASEIGLFKIYPNPAQEEITLTASGIPLEKISVELYTLTGHKLTPPFSTGAWNTGTEARISIGHLAPGAYILEATYMGKRFHYKLLKQ